MLIRVVVDTPEDFDKWVAQQKDGSGSRMSPAGRQTFLSLNCVNCHTVRGTPAAGKFGPDLTPPDEPADHCFRHDSEHRSELERLGQDPQSIKPGNLMPDMQLDDNNSTK